MRFGNLIFGSALLLVAATLALTITFRNDAEGTGKGQSAEAANPSLRTGTGSYATQSPISSTRGRAQGARTSRQPLPDVEDLEVTMDDSPSTSSLTPVQRQDIAKRLPWVRNNALARLDRMTERLELTPVQQHKVFPELLRGTTGYHPAMVINYPPGVSLPTTEVASTEKSPDEAIHDSLDPEQQEDFLQQQLDDQAWWDEIVAQLEADFDASVTAEGGPVAAGQAPSEDIPVREIEPNPQPQPQQGNNLFDLLNE